MLVTVELYNKALDEISVLNQQLEELKAQAMCVLSEPEDPRARCILVEQKDAKIAELIEALWRVVEFGPRVAGIDRPEGHHALVAWDDAMCAVRDVLANTPTDRVLVDREKIESSLETLEGAVIDYTNGDLGINRVFQINIVCVWLATLLKEKQC